MCLCAYVCVWLILNLTYVARFSVLIYSTSKYRTAISFHGLVSSNPMDTVTSNTAQYISLVIDQYSKRGTYLALEGQTGREISTKHQVPAHFCIYIYIYIYVFFNDISLQKSYIYRFPENSVE